MQFNQKPASGGLSQHRYNPFTIGSLDFGEAPCFRFIECEKKDEWSSAKVNGFLRMAPMDFPAYGRCYLKSATFFVPYYQVMHDIDSFRQNQASFKGKLNRLPLLASSGTINALLTDSDLSTQVASESNPANFPATNLYDFVNVPTGTGSAVYYFYKLKPLGRRYYKLLKSLGYDFRTFGYLSSGNTGNAVNALGEFQPNLVNLLCYLKVYTDYFLNLHFYNNDELVALLQAVRDGNGYTSSGGTIIIHSNLQVPSLGLRWILDRILLPHHSNLYTNAWNNIGDPTGVLNEGASTPDGLLSFVLPDLLSTATADSLKVTTSGAHIQTTAAATDIRYLTHLGLNSLYALAAYVKRNRLWGSDSVRQAFARFGIKGEDYNSYFVTKIAETSTEIDFSAVMSNSNTESSAGGSPLGAYAGVGLGSLNFEYNYKVSDYGMILTLCWIQIAPLWMHGFDPSVLRKHPFDWYTPEFDGKASRAIPNAELLQGKNPYSVGNVANDTQVYGYTDIYDEYRELRDVVFGDFVIGLAENFLFARDLSKLQLGALHPQTNTVQYYTRDGDSPDLTDPFQFGNSNGDRFYLQLNFDISANRPVSSKSEALDLNGPGEIEGNTDSVKMS